MAARTARPSSRPERRRAPEGALRSDRGAACAARLLDLDGGAGLLELALELVGLLALDALLDGLGRLVDERLGLLEAEAGRRADDLDDLDLLVAGAGEDDVERALLLGGAAVVAAAAGAAAAGAAAAAAETPNSSRAP
jgi:ribosomal protein L12E/L44/L45/RPP1/RPP2